MAQKTVLIAAAALTVAIGMVAWCDASHESSTESLAWAQAHAPGWDVDNKLKAAEAPDQKKAQKPGLKTSAVKSSWTNFWGKDKSTLAHADKEGSKELKEIGLHKPPAPAPTPSSGKKESTLNKILAPEVIKANEPPPPPTRTPTKKTIWARGDMKKVALGMHHVGSQDAQSEVSNLKGSLPKDVEEKMAKESFKQKGKPKESHADVQTKKDMEKAYQKANDLNIHLIRGAEKKNVGGISKSYNNARNIEAKYIKKQPVQKAPPKKTMSQRLWAKRGDKSMMKIADKEGSSALSRNKQAMEKNAKHALGVDQSSPVHKGMEAAYNAAKKLRQTMHKTRKVKATIADALWARRGDGVMKAVGTHEGQNAAYQKNRAAPAKSPTGLIDRIWHEKAPKRKT